MIIPRLVAFLSGAALFLIYGGFTIVLSVLARVVRVRREEHAGARGKVAEPTICVYLSVLNEAEVIVERLANILETTYPVDKLQVIVVSDGSTDGTVRLAHAFAAQHPGAAIRVIDQAMNRGQAAAQNLLAEVSDADILVSTDADARFVPYTLSALVAPFQDPRVGVVGGRVHYETSADNALGRAYNNYRKMEWRLRQLETDLGVLVKVDGPCVAYRRTMWTPIEDFEDVDQVITLIARKQGLICVQADDATCFDRANQHATQEIRQRRRMTRKAMLSTFNQWGWRETVAHPGFTLTLFCHKILRFFSPVFCSAFTLAGAALLRRRRLLWTLPLGLLTIALGPLRRAFGSFLLAQLAFAGGLLDWLRGDRGGAYLPTRRTRRGAVKALNRGTWIPRAHARSSANETSHQR